MFSQNIGMEFCIKKCCVIIMNRGKVKSTDRIELPSGEKIKERKKKTDIKTRNQSKFRS